MKKIWIVYRNKLKLYDIKPVIRVWIAIIDLSCLNQTKVIDLVTKDPPKRVFFYCLVKCFKIQSTGNSEYSFE